MPKPRPIKMFSLKHQFARLSSCMKHISFVIASLSFCSGYASHSILVPRSITHNATYELALDNYHIYHHTVPCCEIRPKRKTWPCRARNPNNELAFSFYVTPFYTQSSNSSTLARYFLPGNASALNIQEDGSGNVGSLWLNLIAAPGLYFSSKVKISPVRKAVGSYFYSRLDFSRLLPDAPWPLKNIWFSASFAVVQVQHSLRIREALTGDMTYGTIPGITTGIQALNNPAWTAGRFSTTTLKRTGVDDIQLKLGDDWFFSRGQSHVGMYLDWQHTDRAQFDCKIYLRTIGGNHPWGLRRRYQCRF